VSCPPRPIQLNAAGQPIPAGPTDCNCPTCAPCATDPWVILADITLKGGVISRLDCDSHRRYVASFRDFFYTCAATFQPNPALLGLFRDEAALRLEAAADPAAAVAAEAASGLRLDKPWTDALTKRVKDLTIDQVHSQPRDSFVTSLSAGLSGAVAVGMAEKLKDVWDKASEAWTVAHQ